VRTCCCHRYGRHGDQLDARDMRAAGGGRLDNGCHGNGRQRRQFCGSGRSRQGPRALPAICGAPFGPDRR